jgi:hypothetical protein
MTAPTCISGNYDAKHFVDWRNSLLQTASIPEMPLQADFQASIVAFETATKQRDQAQRQLNQITKDASNRDEAAIAEIQKRVQELDAARTAACDDAEATAYEILDELDECFSRKDSHNDDAMTALMTCAALMQAAGPKGGQIARHIDICGSVEDLMALFCDKDQLLTRFMSAGGPKKNEYGRALQIYKKLLGETDAVLQRLALAVSLELCTPVDLKVGKGYEIDPIKRFEHYKRAYLAGELDPLFSTFSVWELRMAVDSDARDEELAWGRESLRNYRPDLCYSANPQWRYCMIVKQDVGYNAPVFWRKDQNGQEMRTYDQILSGGGKCGPRAWYGRFSCKAFGIPTWGCQQPGHAALLRHTINGWTSCLGGGIHKSWWGAEVGNFFLWETQARSACQTDDEYMYMKRVLRLEWAAVAKGEDRTAVSRSAEPNSKALWFSLAMIQRKRVGTNFADKCPPKHPKSSVVTLYDKIMKQVEQKEPIVRDGNCIIIPGAAFTKPPKQNNQVHIHRSFLGGYQLFIQTQPEVEYTLDNLPGRYNLSVLVSTVHRDERPMSVTIDDKDKREIYIPYTMGRWQETEPIEITIGSGSCKLTFQRGTAKYGFAVKHFKLTPA